MIRSSGTSVIGRSPLSFTSFEKIKEEKKKEDKKKPEKSLKEKRAAKKEKKAGK